MKNMDKYEVRKTVGFELKSYIKTREILKGEDNYKTLDARIKHIKPGEFEEGFNWNQFCIDGYTDFLEKSKNISKFLVEINAEIRKNGGDNSKKGIYFDINNLKKEFKYIPSLRRIGDFYAIKDKLIEIESDYNTYLSFLEKLDTDVQLKNEKQSDFSKILRKIAYLNRNFLTIFEFLGSNNGKSTDEELKNKYNNLLVYLGDNFERQNYSIIISNINETNGTEIGKYTFNKYALFRRETSGLKREYENIKKLNEKSVIKMIDDSDIIDDRGNKIDLDINTIKNIYSDFDFNGNIDEVISELDVISGNIINDEIQNFTKDYKLDNNIISLEFSKKSNSKDDYKNGPNDIKLYGEDIIFYFYKDGELRESKKLKLKKGQSIEGYKYLDLIDKADLTGKNIEKQKLANKFLKILFKNKNKNYVIIKNFRDILAKYRGNIRQDLRAKEREFINESMIRYYANLLEKDGNYFIALTDKENIKDIKIEEYIQEVKGPDNFNIFIYSQLHFKALEKLCLSDDGTLIIDKKLNSNWKKYINKGIDYRGLDQDFKTHIIESLNKLKQNNGEDWTEYIPEIEKLCTIEEIVNFINKNFYKLEKSQISSDKLFKLADSGDIKLFQIYNKDFNIYDDRFISDEEELTKREKELEYQEKFKINSKNRRKAGKKPNLFTFYFREIFKNTDTFLGQEGGIFFRKGDEEHEKKRYRNNKFLITFNILFNKGHKNYNAKFSDKKDDIMDMHMKNTTLNYYDKIIKKDEIVIMGIDRGSISEDLSKKDSKISMIGYSIIKLKKQNGKFVLNDILKSGDINGLKRKKDGSDWDIITKGDNKEKDIDFKNILQNLKMEIQEELEKLGKRDIIKIIEKKKGLTGLLINKVIKLFIEYNVDYISLENLDNIFEDGRSFKEAMEENTLSAYLYQNFEIQLFNKLQYIILKSGDIEQKQFFPIYKIDDLKNLESSKWFSKNDGQDKAYKDYKIIGNVVFVKTGGTSSICINCDNKIKQHGIKCSNCGIDLNSSGSKLKLNNYVNNFVRKDILVRQNLQKDFNNDARAGFFIAKKGKEYLEYLSNNKK